MTTMKKNYITPQTKSYTIHISNILAGSGDVPSTVSNSYSEGEQLSKHSSIWDNFDDEDDEQ